jgi:hypothetical protein
VGLSTLGIKVLDMQAFSIKTVYLGDMNMGMCTNNGSVQLPVRR